MQSCFQQKALATPTSNLFAHTPWHLQVEFFPFLYQHRIHPELYLSADILEQITPLQLTEISRGLHANNLRCTLHAPFEGMDPGSKHSKTRDKTRLHALQTIHLAERLQPLTIVFHSGYTHKKNVTEMSSWVQSSIEFWTELLPYITKSNSVIALENVFEDEPTPLRQIIEGIKSQRIRHCFDIGHFNILSKVPLESWFAELGRYCVECHLHDNHGDSDDHLPVGDGTVNFKVLINLLKRYAPAALWTLEAHSLEKLRRTYAAILPNLDSKQANQKAMY
jgi:sugar phosphate isomerase/epimerase